MVFGRSPATRSRAEALAGRPFEPMTELVHSPWRCELLASVELPWHQAVSVGYRPRSEDPFALRTGPSLTHVARLARVLQDVLFRLTRRAEVTDVAVMPLSCRNP